MKLKQQCKSTIFQIKNNNNNNKRLGWDIRADYSISKERNGSPKTNPQRETLLLFPKPRGI